MNYTTVPGEKASECNSSFLANYTLDLTGTGSNLRIQYLPSTANNELSYQPAVQDWRRYACDGMQYRPVNLPQMPMTAVQPYFSNQNFLFTPAEVDGYYGSCDVGRIPALAMQVQQETDATATVMVGAGDTFVFGSFWPAPATVHTLMNVDINGSYRI